MKTGLESSYPSRRAAAVALGRRILCALMLFPALAAAAEQAITHTGHETPAATGETEGLSHVGVQLPQVTVIRQDGKEMSLTQALDDGRTVILNFVFVSCTTICPMQSHLFASVQSRLGADMEKVHLVSISIDPDNDRPEKLLEHARKLKAGPQWDLYTGKLPAMVAIQKAFGVYRGDKMNHVPVTFLRTAPGASWVRLDGLVSADRVVREFRSLAKP